MNNDALKDILSQILKEAKETNEKQKYFNTMLESFAENINHFEHLVKNQNVQVEPPDLKPLEQLLDYNFSQINKTIQNQPKNVTHEKRILFYPEGNGKNFLKLIVKRIISFAAIVAIVYLAADFGIGILKQNVKYKRMYDYLYYNASEDGKEYLENLEDDFANDSIRKIKVDELKYHRKNNPK